MANVWRRGRRGHLVELVVEGLLAVAALDQVRAVGRPELGRHGGVVAGAGRLPEEEEVERAAFHLLAQLVQLLFGRLWMRLSGVRSQESGVRRGREGSTRLWKARLAAR